MTTRSISAALLVLLTAASGCKQEPAPKPAPPPREVEVLTVTPTEVRDTGDYLGSLISRQSVTLLPQIAGYVRKIRVTPGQLVKAGDVVIEIDARHQVAALESAQAQHQSALSNLELARRTYERTQALAKEGLATAQEVDRTEAASAAADAATRATAATISQSRVDLQFHAVRAPIAGSVGDVLIRLGDYVTGSTPLTSVTQGQLLEVSVTIPAERARSIKPDTMVEVVDASGKVLVASALSYVAPQADARTQLVEVKATFANDSGLRPNEMVRTRLVYGSRRALQVPALSVVRQSGQPFVFLVQQGPKGASVVRRPVTLGPLGEQSYVVEKGLAAGDRIATSALQSLRDGAPIKPKARAAAALDDPRAEPGATSL